MKSVKANLRPSVRIEKNTDRKDRPQWARIVDRESGNTLHVGQVKYIKGVAKKKYNLLASM